ncbi:hypothetical protein, partial [Clostridium perfringens]
SKRYDTEELRENYLV